MTSYLDERYSDWLYGQVCSVKVKSPTRTFRNLFHILYTTEFIWIVPNDDNRVEDGKDLRYEFMDETGVCPQDRDHIWLTLGCSWLEMLVALARRFAFEADREVSECFWEMLHNLGLGRLNDRSDISQDDVVEVLDRVTWRTYEPDGRGGLFPLKHAENDQRKVELWYQLNAYILERS